MTRSEWKAASRVSGRWEDLSPGDEVIFIGRYYDSPHMGTRWRLSHWETDSHINGGSPTWIGICVDPLKSGYRRGERLDLNSDASLWMLDDMLAVFVRRVRQESQDNNLQPD